MYNLYFYLLYIDFGSKSEREVKIENMCYVSGDVHM